MKPLSILDVKLEDLEAFIRRDIIVRVTVEMGYQFDQERIDRITEEAGKLKEEGQHPIICICGAIDIDILLYGDPLAPVLPCKAFHEILKEIYE